MKKIIPVIPFILLAACLPARAQSLSPKTFASGGGYFVSGSQTLSWTMGETFNTTLQSGSNLVTQGEQQPYLLLKILNLKTFIQGYYAGSGHLKPVLFNSGRSSDPTASDSITVELHAAGSPYTLVANSKVLLHTDGSAAAVFPASVLFGSYYIVIRQRNALETWSKNAFTLSTVASTLDFTK